MRKEIKCRGREIRLMKKRIVNFILLFNMSLTFIFSDNAVVNIEAKATKAAMKDLKGVLQTVENSHSVKVVFT